MIVRKYPLVTLLFVPLLAACAASADEQAALGEWALENAEGAASVRLIQDSSVSIKDEYATKDVVPKLVISCTSGNPELTAQIDWGRFISSFSTELGFKVDDNKREWQKWRVDRSEKVTMSSSSADTDQLVALVSGGNTLDVEISPYSEGPVNAQFDLAQFDEALSRLRSNCR